MKKNRKIVPLIKDGKNLSLNSRQAKKASDNALVHLVGATDSPAYIISVDENTGQIAISSALTDRLSFERKK